MLKPKELKTLLMAAPVLKKVMPAQIESEAEYDAAVQMLDALIAETAGEAEHAFSPLIHALGTQIQAYESQHQFIPDLSPHEMLQFLMTQHQLKQSDLRAEIGSQGVVSEILHGKRTLNSRQIQALSQRFAVSPAVFYPAADSSHVSKAV